MSTAAHTNFAKKDSRVTWQPDPQTGDLCPYVAGQQVAWAPMPGSQEAYLSCPVFETLLHGGRGGGKTVTALMDFAQHVGQGFGTHWSGLVFRKSFPELEDVIDQTKRWFPRIWPDAQFHSTRYQWEWATGEKLLFRHAEREVDYWRQHGANRPFILWEELTTWPNLNLYHMMKSVCRSPIAAIPRKIRATANPYGTNHNNIKQRWKLGTPSDQKKREPKDEPIVGPILTDESGNQRVAIRSTILENKVLLNSDPGYLARLSSAAPNPAALLAWATGDWDVVSGGALDDVWVPSLHVVPNIPPDAIPKGWRLTRSYDHGQSKPFSVLWAGISDGSPALVVSPTLTPEGVVHRVVRIGEVAGDTVLLMEYYGAREGEINVGLNMTALEIAAEIRLQEDRHFAANGLNVHPGPADNSVWDTNSSGTGTVARDMAKPPNRVSWTRSDKGPGSRIQGLQQIRKMLKAAVPSVPKEGEPAIVRPDGTVPRRDPALFVCQGCTAWIETVPNIPRDPKQMDDVDTKACDHAYDATRYLVRRRNNTIKDQEF